MGTAQQQSRRRAKLYTLQPQLLRAYAVVFCAGTPPRRAVCVVLHKEKRPTELLYALCYFIEAEKCWWICVFFWTTGRYWQCQGWIGQVSSRRTRRSGHPVLRAFVANEGEVRGRVNAHFCAYRIKIWPNAKSWARCVKRTQKAGPLTMSWGKRSLEACEYCERNARIVCEQYLISLKSFDEPGEVNQTRTQLTETSCACKGADPYSLVSLLLEIYHKVLDASLKWHLSKYKVYNLFSFHHSHFPICIFGRIFFLSLEVEGLNFHLNTH